MRGLTRGGRKKGFNIEAFIEPLVRKLSSDQTDDSFGKRKANLLAPWIDGVLNVVYVASVDCIPLIRRYLTPKKKKIKKYEEPLAQLGRVEHVKYQFVPFAISLFGNIGPSGLHYSVLLNGSGKTMNSTFWLNRIVFCIFKSIPTMISKVLLAIGVEYERNAESRFSNSDAFVPGLNGSFTILDAMSIDPCNSSNEHLINSDVNNSLLAGEKYKIAKYAKPISSVNENSHAQYNLCPFVFSLLGSLGNAAMAFLEDFVVVVKERTGRIFNRVYWQNRIVFSIFKGMVKVISDSLSV
ncbi:hypothetical protein P9112_011880 [Eukaryota sp. TZLM1-RC]